MAIHGKVYNVSRYLSRHPGGAQIMLKYAGRDATIPFDDVGHSLESLLFDIDPEALVGVLEQQPKYAVKVRASNHVAEASEDSTSKSSWNMICQWIYSRVFTSWSHALVSKKEGSLEHTIQNGGLNTNKRLSTLVLGGIVLTCLVILLYVKLRWPSMIEYVVSRARPDAPTDTSSYGIPSWGV